nr:GDSL-type esterase/lipase family protein [uncultured Niameybacter sp.]
MNSIQYNNEALTFLGRTLEDLENGVMYFNWTCSGFLFDTNSKKIEAQICTHIVSEAGEVLEPWLAIFIDEEEEPKQLIKLEAGCKWYTLFENPEGNMHTIKVIKRTEAQYSKTGLKQLALSKEAQLHKSKTQYTCQIEFIGDSLTCGYGNESDKVDSPFRSREENGWEAYAARAARKLLANFHCISASGIGIYSSFTRENQINNVETMGRIYPEIDYYLCKQFPELQREKWDFKCFKPDYIVINLGTNDWSYINYNPSIRIEEFKKAYISFIKQVRELNGSEPIIICCAAPIEFVQASVIEEVVKGYRELTDDINVVSLAFNKLEVEDGLGTASHPTVKSHVKGAEQLVNFILGLKK